MITLAELLIGLKNRLQVAMEQHDQETLHNLRVTFDEMLDASYSIGSREQCAMLDDLVYAASHARMGVDWKAKDAIPSDEQINAVFRPSESS